MLMKFIINFHNVVDQYNLLELFEQNKTPPLCYCAFDYFRNVFGPKSVSQAEL